MAGELSRHPDLAHRFYELGPGQTHRNLTAMIDAATTEGEITVPSAAEAAEHLIGMWQGLANFKLPLGLGVDDLISGIEARVTRAVEVFLTAYRPLNARPTPRRS